MGLTDVADTVLVYHEAVKAWKGIEAAVQPETVPTLKKIIAKLSSIWVAINVGAEISA